MNRVLSAAAVALTLPVAACGGTDDARFQSPAPSVDAGDDGASATGPQCGTNQPATGPIRLASGKSPSSIAIDGTNVYWIDSALGTVNEVPSCGGPATTLVTTSTLGSSTLIPAGIAVQGGDVYFTTQDPWNPDGDDGAVWRVPSSGGTPTMLVQGLDRPGRVAVTGASMYWIESWETHADDGRVVKAPLDGSSMDILASAQNGPFGLALGGGYVVWTTSGFVDSVRGTIWVAPVGSEVVDGVSVGQNMPVGVAIGGTNAFWADEGDPNVANSGSIMKKPLDPNAAADPVTLASGGAPQGIAVDGTYAYWTDSQAQTVNRVPIAGGAPTTVAAQQVAPLAIAVDDKSVYWTTFAVGSGVGSVMKIAK